MITTRTRKPGAGRPPMADPASRRQSMTFTFAPETLAALMAEADRRDTSPGRLIDALVANSSCWQYIDATGPGSSAR